MCLLSEHMYNFKSFADNNYLVLYDFVSLNGSQFFHTMSLLLLSFDMTMSQSSALLYFRFTFSELLTLLFEFLLLET